MTFLSLPLIVARKSYNLMEKKLNHHLPEIKFHFISGLEGAIS